MPVPTVEVQVFDDDLTTPLGTLDDAFGIVWKRRRLTMGGGELSIMHNAPSATATRLRPNNVVKILVDGQVKQAFIMRYPSREDSDKGGVVKIAGPDLTDLLRSAVVRPPGGFDATILSDDRPFGWMSVDYDPEAEGWLDYTQLFNHGTYNEPLVPTFAKRPEGWFDGDAERIWTVDVTDHGTYFTHPPGTSFFRRDTIMTNPDAPEPQTALVQINSYNSFKAYWDNQEVRSSGGGWNELVEFEVELVAGAHHVFAAKVTNANRPAGSQNLGGLMMSMYSLNPDGSVRGVLMRTWTDDPPGRDSGRMPGWYGLPYPASPPGVTIGYILARLFDEAQDEGELTGLTRSFTAAVDSNGVPWSRKIEFVCDVGNDNLLSVSERMRRYRIDFEVDHNGVYHVWQNRGSDLTGSVTVPLAGPGSPYNKGIPKGEWGTFNALVIRTSDKWLQRPDPGPVTGRKTAFIELGLTPTAASGAEIGDLALEDYETGLLVPGWTISHAKSTHLPGDDYDLADVIRAPYLTSIVGDWALADVRVDGYDGRVLDNDVEYVLELSAP